MRTKLAASLALCVQLALSSAYAANVKPAPAGKVKPAPQMVHTNITYQANGKTFKGYAVYQNTGKTRPLVIIVPEWWGVTSYIKHRAQMVANLGYTAVVADMFGNGDTVSTPAAATKAVTPFYNNPAMAKAIIAAAISAVIKLPQTNTAKAAVMGYCFGGTQALSAVAQGMPFVAAASFHGGLSGIPKPVNNKAQLLVCNGAADPMVPAADLKAFTNAQKAAGVQLQVINYPGALHAFTNPNATRLGKKYNMPIAYNAQADASSWQSLKAFLAKVLPAQ